MRVRILHQMFFRTSFFSRFFISSLLHIFFTRFFRTFFTRFFTSSSPDSSPFFTRFFTRCLPDLHRHFKHFEQRKEVPPPSAILQASRGGGEEVRTPGRWSRGGVGGVQGCLAPFWQENFYPITCELWAGRRQLMGQPSAERMGRVELLESESFKIQIVSFVDKYCQCLIRP